MQGVIDFSTFSAELVRDEQIVAAMEARSSLEGVPLPAPVHDLTLLPDEDLQRFAKDYSLSMPTMRLLDTVRREVCPIDMPSEYSQRKRNTKRKLTKYLEGLGLAGITVRFLLKQRQRRFDKARKAADRAGYEATAAELRARLQNALDSQCPDMFSQAMDCCTNACEAVHKLLRDDIRTARAHMAVLQ